MTHISAILAGFSIVSLIVLLFAYLFFLPQMRKTQIGKVTCCLLLLSLALLQYGHFLYFFEGLNLLQLRSYCFLLITIPPAFLFFSREILFPQVQYTWAQSLYWLPVLISFWIPIKFLPALAFLFGTAYTFWLARLIFQLRDQRGRFKFEMFFFGMFAMMAFVALLLGLSLPILDPHIFYVSYSNAVSLAVAMVVAALLIFPELLNDIVLVTELAYAKSTLNDIDTKQKIRDLKKLMVIDKQFQDEDLNLGKLAELLDLNSHQLSELINTEYKMGFPRFIREQRIKEAKHLLIGEPSASVLSISMATGFRSQSNFYTAFKESTGYSPGNYRKNHTQYS